MVKEFLQYDANVENFLTETESMLNGSPQSFSNYYHDIKSKLKNFKDKLDGYNTYKLVADEVMSHAHT